MLVQIFFSKKGQIKVTTFSNYSLQIGATDVQRADIALQQNCLRAAFKLIITRWGKAKLYFHVHTAISKIMLSGPVPESLRRKIYDHMGDTPAAHFWIHQNL